MKKLICLSFVILSLAFAKAVFAQGFIPPANGNAVVYFVRVSAMGGVIPFEFFNGRQFIGRIIGLAYFRYELPAGESLLWASSENKEFVECNLKAGGTYLVLVNVKMGMVMARIGLEPITWEHADFQRVKSHILDKASMDISQESINSTQKRLEEKGFFDDNMDKYETKWKGSKSTKKMNADMLIPEENLK